MNRLLFVDALRRLRWTLFWLTAFASGVWFAGSTISGSRFAVAASMALTACAAWLASQSVAPREVGLLPVSRREKWRTRWVFTVVVAVVVTAVGKMLGFVAGAGFNTSLTIDHLLLSSSLDISFVGCLTAVVALSRPTIGALAVSFSPILPLAFNQLLPTGWSEISTGTILFIACGAIAGAGSYFVTPTFAPQAGPDAIRSVYKARRGLRWPEFARLTGLPRLFVKIWSTGVAMQIVVMVTVTTTMFWIEQVLERSEATWFDQAASMGLLPFTTANGASRLGVLWLMAIVSTDSVTRMLRLLRTLPLSLTQLNITMLSLSAGIWVMTWLILLILHAFVVGHAPGSFKLPLLFALAGVGCLFQVLRLRWNQLVWVMVVSAGSGLFTGLTRETGATVDYVYVVLGLAGLAAAGWINGKTLSKRRETYKVVPRRTAFGTEMPN